ncbi:LamG-like jellyroll fold domain-containing protein [Pedococcus sp. 5OH_020]|uniref:LamG-like jellyroll fold domain-containing protein n=1 Tax=Pedococcus sp. 5OH_020 TaxID=2989814 RepID=UPI0022E9FF17|nr:LamG-like jellyroll fold domain-containing protein [Pedococcus sp. 5OH_020]
MRTRDLHRRGSRFARGALVALVAASAALAHSGTGMASVEDVDPARGLATQTDEEHAHTDLVGVSMEQLERTANPAVGRRPTTGAAARQAAAAVAAGPEVSGSWGPVVPAAVVPAFTALLPNGKVLMWDSVGDNATESYPDQTFTRAAVWDPATGVSTRIDVVGANIFCAGFVQLSDGRVFVAGGNKDQALNGIRLTHIFDWETLTWTRGPDMAGERWYPSVAALMDGQALIVAGGPTIAEIRGVDGSVRQLPGITAPSGRAYPFLQSAPDGRVLNSGSDNAVRRLNWWGTGSLEASIGRDGVDRSYGSYATYAPGLTLVTGGGSSTVNGVAVPYSSTSIIDTRSGTLATRAAAPMANRRRQHNLTLLPDGTLLATGGMSVTGDGLISLANAVYAAERWDPAADSWSTLASASVVRQYHSTAMLLPDGRVLTGGGGICGSCQQQGYLRKDIEVYSPPYLFARDGSGSLAPRPTVAQAPSQVTLDRPFTVSSPEAARIAKAALIRLGAPTHSQDQGQRYLPLSFTTSGQQVTITAPPNAAEAPPGYYMLFVVDVDGVPSVAPIVQVRSAAPGTFQGGATRSGGPAAIAYAGTGATGVAQPLEPGTWRASRGNLATVGNDQTSSLDLAAGWAATICVDDAMTTCTTMLPGPATSLPTGFDNAISAIRVQPYDGDTQAPTAPTGLTATGGLSRTELSWSASSDDVGVTGYAVHRGTASGFTPTSQTLVATVTGTSYTDSPLAAGRYYYQVTAHDLAGNTSAPSQEATALVTADTTAPTVSVTSPTAGSSVSGTVSVTATAGDDTGVSSVQLRLDGTPLGGPDTSPPYQAIWNTTSSTNGFHTVSATATDAAGNVGSSTAVTVTVSNATPPPPGLVGAWSFDAGSGTTATDSSGQGNTGTLNGPSWTSSGRLGGALVFDGVNDRVDIADSTSLGLTSGMTLEAWVRPTTTSGWRSVLVKERPGGRAYSLYSSDASSHPSSVLRLKSDVAVAGPAVLPVGTWSHVASTYDGVTHRLYVNGLQVAAVPRSGKIGTSAKPLRIGGNTIAGEWFSGAIDEVRVYNRALSAAEVAADQSRPLP